MSMPVGVFRRGTSHGFPENLGKVQAVVKSQGIGDDGDGKAGIIQHAAGRFNPKRCQIFFRRLIQALFEGAE